MAGRRAEVSRFVILDVGTYRHEQASIIRNMLAYLHTFQGDGASSNL